MTEPKQKKAVIFDIGGVLLKHIWPLMRERLAERIGISVETFDEVEQEHVADLHRGKISEERFWRLVCGKIGARIPHWDDGESSPLRSSANGLIEPNPIMVGTARRLKEMGFKTGIISNIESSSIRMVEGLGVHNHFDSVVYSCDVGYIKPEPKIFEIALEQLAALPEESLFIDDRTEHVTAARQLGLTAHLYEDEVLARKFLADELQVQL